MPAARDFCRDAPFCFTSTNKVYGDGPNALDGIGKVIDLKGLRVRRMGDDVVMEAEL